MRATETDVTRALEARIDARLQAVSTRFAGVDARFGLLEQRLARLEATGTLDTTTIAEITAAVAAVLLSRVAESATEVVVTAENSPGKVHLLDPERLA